MNKTTEKFIFDVILTVLKKYEATTEKAIHLSSEAVVKHELRTMHNDMKALIIASDAEVRMARDEQKIKELKNS